MTSNSTEYAAGKEHDTTWQLHSSTDSYLNWASDSNDKMTPPTTRYREADSSTNPSPKTTQPALLGPMTPPPFAIPSPMASSATDSSSMVSLHGHVASPERATSPSYFAKLYNHGQSRSKNPTSPSITFSTALTDSKNDARTSPRSPIPSDAQADRTSTTTQKYTSLLPSPPGTQRVVDSESTGKSRRPSSVFEHVGNVWERFGRKVHNARTSTSEQANASSSLSRRSASQVSPATTSAAESTEAFESHRMSSSSSSQSQASPSQLTYLDNSDQASSPNLPLAGSLDHVRQPTSAVNRTDTTASSNAGTSEDENPEGLSYLAAAPQLGLTSQTGSSYAQNTMPGHRRTSSAFDRVLIQVTDDNERFSVVDISGVHSADAIKERMLAKLHLFDVDFSGLQLFRTEVGQSEATGHIVNDDALLVLCLQMGDDRGTLKFLVQQTGPQPNSSGRAMPPPVSSGGTPGMNVTPRRPSTNGSSASQRLRSGSQSSRSSVNDQIAYTDPFASSEESSNRNSGSSLTRTKAQTRRGHSSANPSEEGRSPVQSSLAYQTSQDRRSIASSSDSPAHDRNARSDVLRNVASEAGLGVKAGTATGPQPSGGVNGRRSSQTELARKRMEEDNGPQRLLNTTSNQRSQRLERSDEGLRDPQRANGGPSLMIHNTKSMDDLRPPDSSRLSDAAVHHELKLHPSFDRDGRYPDPAIMRPATAAPSTSRESNSGHRQYSSEAQSGNGAFGSMPSQSDPRILTRNRSAQAALPGGSQMNVQGPQQAPQLRSPSLPNQYAVADPRYTRNGHNEDPRYGASVGYSSHTAPTRSGNGPSRPQQSAPPTYSYPNLPFQQPSRMSVPSAGYMNEFGARAGQSQPFNTYHGHDPRLVNSRQGPPPPRPYSIHEQGPYPRPFPQQSPQPPPGFLPREDPFTNRYFPASSSRQVSEFQLKAGHLQPGMTVQETLRAKTPAPSGNPYGPQYPSGPSYGPRDPRQGGPTQVYQGQPNPASMQHRQSQTQLHQQHVQQQQQARQQQQQQMHPHELQHHHQRHSQHQDHPSSHSQMPSRNPYERSSSLMATSPPNTHSQPSTARSSQYQTSLNGAGSEPHSRQSTSRPNTSERSSGSSFSNHSSSHGRHHSAEDDRRGRGSMEESFSAPTSTRSSHSSTTPVKTPDQDTRRSYPSARREGDLGDDELAHIRPLPQPPGPTSSAQRRATSQDRSSQPLARKSEEEDTLRAGEWASLWKSLDNNSGGTVSGTAISGSSGGDGDTLRADSATPGLMSQTGGETITPEIRARMQRAHSVSLPPEDNGTIASFGTFDDDESESGTWAQPLDSDVDAPRLPLQFPGDRDSHGGDTLQPGAASVLAASASNLRRPELRLTIDPAIGPTQMPSSSRHSGGSPMRASGLLSSGSTGVTRSNSFAQTDSDWAFRPPPEQLYENLDNFFPKHDLDKPLLDTAAVPEGNVVSSPRSESSHVTAPGPASTSAAAATQQQQLLGLRGRHKKSIRLVAQDRKRFLDKTEDCPSSQEPDVSSGLLRRRSTKLWGTKVIEMTPGQEVAAPASAVSAESPSSESSARPVFKWVKGDLIGKGTYGRVYLALNATTGEMIAVKQVELPRTASDREDSRQKGVVAALKSEIETLKDLDHPHIVSYLGFEETRTFLSIFLEYVPGGSVGSCLRKHGKFEEQTIKSFLHQILEGLAYLHSKGILHRDLKADNILVDFEGVCKISDFGTVRRSDDIYGNVENMSLQGSIFWMAPEVVSLSKKGYSAKVDIWSLGCVVLEMFAGRRPWSEDEAVQAMFKIGAERKAPPIPADVKLSKQAAHFLRNCFEVDPAKRPTAQRLLDHVFTVTQPEWRFQQSALFRSLHR